MGSRHEEMREKVRLYHKAHPEVWTLFCQFTNELIDRGFKNYSARGIFHRIRWEADAPSYGLAEFKLSNNHSPFYARAFMKKFPEHSGFFRLRDQPSKDAPELRMAELGPNDFRSAA